MTERIQALQAAAAASAFYSDDKLAIAQGASVDGHFYQGVARSPGFTRVRHPGEATAIDIRGENGSRGEGDAVTCQYSGVGGRMARFLGEDGAAQIERHVVPVFLGQPLDSFRRLTGLLRDVRDGDGQPLHPGLRYGVSQALLSAVASSRRCLPAEVLAAEYDLEIARAPVPIFAQTGDDREVGVDKAIMRRVDVLPHGLINAPAKFGHEGEILEEFARWIVERVRRHGEADYRPILHFDCYGVPGMVFEADLGRIADYLAKLGEAVQPHSLQVEMPIDAGGIEAQLEAMAGLRERLRALGAPVKIIVDEWANTPGEMQRWADAGVADVIHVKCPDVGGWDEIVETFQYCRRRGQAAYLGGTCNETDVSARISAQAAMVLAPVQILAKPGMGIDEGVTIVSNEMGRVVRARAGSHAGEGETTWRRRSS